MTKLIRIGFGNMVAINRVVAVASANSAPIKRAVQESRGLIDTTRGRKTRAVIFTDSGHIVLAGLTPETIAERGRRGQD